MELTVAVIPGGVMQSLTAQWGLAKTIHKVVSHLSQDEDSWPE